MARDDSKQQITKRGKVTPGVWAVRPAATFDQSAAKHAAARIRRRRKGVTLGGLAIKDLINEGRR